MAMTESQYYGGSRQEADDAQECFRLREKALRNGFRVERKPGVVTIVINPDPQPGTCVPTAPNPHYYCKKCGRDLWDSNRRFRNPHKAPAVFIDLDGNVLCQKCFCA
ncbi:hypothetical protein [Bellilinea sp.]|uniref:hypothetical protein n=1 Tax=Bellilinea sp. TaxID=2838785 RepID=UPI0021DE195F|nr:hypothetical protein [Bellilinea sp.]GIV64881.1 MAG: hypothetical protein KatS3mg046_141 [Bellilinea sp.]